MKYNVDLQQVEFIPKQLQPGVLYVSMRFKVASHLCACGCATKVVTPLGPCEWKFTEKSGKPTLYPSIGNWQFPCKSHYWITAGEIRWSYNWSEEQIRRGYESEQKRRELYYETKYADGNLWKRISRWFTSIVFIKRVS